MAQPELPLRELDPGVLRYTAINSLCHWDRVWPDLGNNSGKCVECEFERRADTPRAAKLWVQS